MNQRKSRELIRNNLYRVDDVFVRSAAQAAELASGCTVSARALIMRAEADSDLPAEYWSGFYRALDEQERKASQHWREKIKRMMQAINRHRRLATTSLILVLVLAFFTLVPAGRAIAESIFNYVIAVFDGQLEINQADEQALYEERGYSIPSTMPPNAEEFINADGELIMESKPVYFDSVAAFNETYQLNAVELKNDQLTFVEAFEINHLFAGKSLRSLYQTADGKAVSLLEEWYKGDGQSIGLSGEVQEHSVLNGRNMLYMIDASNGSFDGVVLLENSVLKVYADAGVDLDFIWQLLG